MRSARSGRRCGAGGCRLADVADQQVGDGHARVGRLGLVADQHDVVVRGVLAQGFGGDDAGRAGAEDDVFHAMFSFRKKKAVRQNRLRAAVGCGGGLQPQRARGFRLELPSVSQPRSS
jgi:hypothetical protein